MVYLISGYTCARRIQIVTSPKYYATTWEYLSPPLPLPEVNIVAKQLDRKDYAYKCSDAPINAHCNKELCRTRKFGIGAAVAGRYDSEPTQV